MDLLTYMINNKSTIRSICVMWWCSVNIPGVCWWQPICWSIVSVNLEFLNAIHTLQECKPLQRHFGCACHELKESGTVGLVKRPQRSPEPLNLCMHITSLQVCFLHHSAYQILHKYNVACFVSEHNLYKVYLLWKLNIHIEVPLILSASV